MQSFKIFIGCCNYYKKDFPCNLSLNAVETPLIVEE